MVIFGLSKGSRREENNYDSVRVSGMARVLISRRALAPVGTLAPAQTGASALRLIRHNPSVAQMSNSVFLTLGVSHVPVAEIVDQVGNEAVVGFHRSRVGSNESSFWSDGCHE